MDRRRKEHEAKKAAAAAAAAEADGEKTVSPGSPSEDDRTGFTLKYQNNFQFILGNNSEVPQLCPKPKTCAGF